jgi:hypothetical protein
MRSLSLPLLLASIGGVSGVTYNTKYKNGNVLAAHRGDGALITWGDATYGAEVGNVRYAVDFIASNYGAFVSVSAGVVLCWGHADFGSNCTSITSVNPFEALHSVSRMSAPIGGSFAALDSLGYVFNWGDAASGGDNGDVASLLAGGVLSLEQCGEGYAAVLTDEVIVPWSGGTSLSGDPDVWSVVDEELATGSIERVYGNGDAYCVLKDDSSVFCWGDTAGYIGLGPGAITGVVDIFTTDFAFAALDATGTVTAWGDAAFGGDLGGLAPLTGVSFVVSTATAFAALLTDGTVKAWGDANGGTLGAALTSIIAIFASQVGFAAVDSAGAVFGWGTDATPPGGMDPIIDIVSSTNAFAALSSTGKVYVWGEATHIDTTFDINANSILSSGLVTSIYATDSAFAAIYGEDKNVVCWGVSGSGGDCTLDAELYNISYIYGNEMTRTATFQSPTPSPTADPSSAPTTATPTEAPRRPTVLPSVSQHPTKSPQVWPFITHTPTGQPTGQPTESVAPIVSGHASDMIYYCRPKNYVSGSNGMCNHLYTCIIVTASVALFTLILF